MCKICAYLRLMGDDFSPKLVEKKSGIIFSNKNEVGDMGIRGKFNEKPIPYGSATLMPPNEVLDYEYYYAGFDWMISKLCKVVEVSRECGADDIYLELNVYYYKQCNISFEPNALAEIAKANISFCISCIEDKELKDDE